MAQKEQPKVRVELNLGAHSLVSQYFFDSGESISISVDYAEAIKAVQNGDITPEVEERLKKHLEEYRTKSVIATMSPHFVANLEGDIRGAFRKAIDEFFPTLKAHLIKLAAEQEANINKIKA